jgi:hypothetical protein
MQKEVGWGRGQHDEGGRWVGVGKSFPKKNLGLGVGQKHDKKIVPPKKTKIMKKIWLGKKGKEEKYIYLPSKLTFGG